MVGSHGGATTALLLPAPDILSVQCSVAMMGVLVGSTPT